MKKIQPIPSGKPCTDCKTDIPQQRLDACPGTTKCVNCSNVKTKKPITLTKGTGDNTYVETLIVDDDTYNTYLKQEAAERRLIGKTMFEAGEERDDDKEQIIEPKE